jgi:dTDP-4-dehydrorhamnose reductase
VRVLVTGAKGQLGRELLRRVSGDTVVIGLAREEGDITNPDALASAFESFSPDVVINAAAYTAVDKAETEKDRARAVNATGAGNVGRAAKKAGARVVHVSTDYVFDGRGSIPYPTTAPTNPLNVYGETKRDGEKEILSVDSSALIVRTGWLYSSLEQSLVGKIVAGLRRGDQLRFVNDRVGGPTSAGDLAEALWECVARPSITGIQHWVNSGTATWYEFASRIRSRSLELGAVSECPPIDAIPGSQYRADAARPNYSVLDATGLWSALGRPARHWHLALDDVIRELA